MDDPRRGQSVAARLGLLRHGLRTAVAAHDVYISYMRATAKWKSKVVWPTTEIVIEGYPRSGNTFAQVAFEVAQGRTVRMAHHTHAPAQVRWAVTHRIPTVLLIRPAEDAVISYVIHDPHIPLGRALSDWIAFYESLIPMRNEVIVADFHRATREFGAVIRRLNEVYGTSFKVFDSTEENINRCYQTIEELDRRHSKRQRIDETRVARPSDARLPAKAALTIELKREVLSLPFKLARDLYLTFLNAHSVVS